MEFPSPKFSTLSQEPGYVSEVAHLGTHMGGIQYLGNGLILVLVEEFFFDQCLPGICVCKSIEFAEDLFSFKTAVLSTCFRPYFFGAIVQES